MQQQPYGTEVQFVAKGVKKTYLHARDRWRFENEVRITEALQESGHSPRLIESDSTSLTTTYVGITLDRLTDPGDPAYFLHLDGRPEAVASMCIGACEATIAIVGFGGWQIDMYIANIACRLANAHRRCGKIHYRDVSLLDFADALHTDVFYNKPIMLSADDGLNQYLAPETKLFIKETQRLAAAQSGYASWDDARNSGLLSDPERFGSIETAPEYIPDPEMAMQYALGKAFLQFHDVVQLPPEFIADLKRMSAEDIEKRFASLQDAIESIRQHFVGELPEASSRSVPDRIEIVRTQNGSPLELPPPKQTSGNRPSGTLRHPETKPQFQSHIEQMGEIAPSKRQLSLTWLTPVSLSVALALMVAGVSFGTMLAPTGTMQLGTAFANDKAWQDIESPHASREDRNRALGVVARPQDGLAGLRLAAYLKEQYSRLPVLLNDKSARTTKELEQIRHDLEILARAGNVEAEVMLAAIELSLNPTRKAAERVTSSLKKLGGDNQQAADFIEWVNEHYKVRAKVIFAESTK